MTSKRSVMGTHPELSVHSNPVFFFWLAESTWPKFLQPLICSGASYKFLGAAGFFPSDTDVVSLDPSMPPCKKNR